MIVLVFPLQFKMTERIEQRICIEFCQKLDDMQVETIRKIQTALGDQVWVLNKLKSSISISKMGEHLLKVKCSG